MQRKKSSSTSYTGRDFKNTHWDGVSIRTSDTSVTDAALDLQNAQRRVFDKSKILRTKANANNNEGIVHKVWSMKVNSALGMLANSNVGMMMVCQILRNDIDFPEAGAVLAPIVGDIRDTQILQPSPISKVAWENVFRQTASVILGNSLTGGVPGGGFGLVEYEYYFHNPLVFVRPYFLASQCIFISSASAGASVRHNLEVYIEVESCRVKGKEYERLLNEYTQIPSLLERREES